MDNYSREVRSANSACASPFHRAHLHYLQPHIYVAFLTRASFKPSPSRFASRTFARASCAPCSLLSVSLSLSLLLSELVSLRLYRPLYESPPAAGASLPSTPSTARALPSCIRALPFALARLYRCEVWTAVGSADGARRKRGKAVTTKDGLTVTTGRELSPSQLIGFAASSIWMALTPMRSVSWHASK